MKRSTVTPTKINGTFNLAGAATGRWNLTVTNPDGQADKRVRAFRVTAA